VLKYLPIRAYRLTSLDLGKERFRDTSRERSHCAYISICM